MKTKDLIRGICVCVVLLLIPSFSVKAQNITVKFDNVSVEHAMEQLKSRHGYSFVFNTDDVRLDAKVKAEFSNATISEVLDTIFQNQDVKFEIKGKIVHIIRTEAQKSSPKGISSSKIVKGKVTDNEGEPLIGVGVQLKGMTIGTVTDIDGNYEIEITAVSDVLVFSYLGFKQVERKVDRNNVINVVMEADSYFLDEVVAIGYGVQKRSSVTGSISSVKADELPKSANSSINNMLSGRASGMQVMSTSAQPGGGVSIIIRGAGSDQAGNSPLYVIDGFPVNNSSVDPSAGDYSAGTRDPLSTINANDIESIEILKDAASTAIYGARAANGVILITTKRGAEGKTKVDVSYTYSVQKLDRYFDMLDAKGFMTYSRILGKEQYLISNNQYPYGPKPQDFTYYKPKYTEKEIATAGEGTDWWERVTRLGQIHDANISVSGGNSKTKFLVSGNWFSQDGIVVNSSFTRASARINLDHNILDNLKFGLSATGSYVDNGNVQLGGDYNTSGVLVAALQMSPVGPVYDENGNYYINPNDATLPNPVSFREIDDNTIQKRVMGNFYLEYTPIKGLVFKGVVGTDIKSGERHSYIPNTFLHGAASGGKAARVIDNDVDILANITVSYNTTIRNDHNLGVLAGWEYQKFSYDGFSANANDFFTDSFTSNNLGAGKGVPTVGSYRNSNDLASAFARFSYNYKEKILMNVTLRADGAASFGAGNKWGFFPSVSVAWRITQEPFMKNVIWLNSLKLRASFGQTGNSGIGDRALSYYGNPRFPFVFGTDNIAIPANKTQLANPNLKWETTTEANVAIDFGLFKNRVSGTLEYYNKVVSDLLSTRVMPIFNDIRTVADNIGATQLSGVDFELHTVNIDGAFRWTTDLNLSAYYDNWKERNPDVTLQPWQGEHDRIRSIYGYIADGIVQVGQDVPHMEGELPGNLIYRDVNGFDENHKLTGKPDGKINDADKVNLGSSDPSFSFGFGNTFEFYGVDLSIFFYGMVGRKMLNTNKEKFILKASRLPEFDNNMMVAVKDVFTSENPSTTTPGIANNPYPGYSSYLIEDASFMRLKNITIGYTLPQKVLKNKCNMRFFVDIQNPWLVTEYTGVDPEFDSLGAYPNAKSFSVGLNFSF